MEPLYSFWADLLNKFHTATEPIQALWLILGALTILGVTWLVMRGLRDTVATWRGSADPALFIVRVRPGARSGMIGEA